MVQIDLIIHIVIFLTDRLESKWVADIAGLYSLLLHILFQLPNIHQYILSPEKNKKKQEQYRTSLVCARQTEILHYPKC